MSYFNHEFFDILINTLPAQQSEQLRLFIETDDVLGLVSQEVDRSQPVSFADVFFKELFRKVSDAPLGIDTAEVAVSGFFETEEDNKLTNERLILLRDFIIKYPGHSLSATVRRIREQVSIILGPCPAHLEPGVTFGATYDLKRNTSIFGRFNNPSVTLPALEKLREMNIIRRDYTVSAYPRSENPPSPYGAVGDDFVIVKGSKLGTVPKNAKTDRAYAPEPTVNITYQRGIGLVIYERLRNFGVNIKTLADTHKDLARKGSVDGSLATVDLTNASNRITIELVRLLLPNDWFELLDALRSHYIEYNDEFHKLNMFSTNGNGFTFELETLLFLSISLTTSKVVYLSAPPDISVFGDDIILPTIYYDNLSEISKVFGMVINNKKSFNTGFFRESCGGDFYRGSDVRGYNVKALPKTASDWISIANAIRRVCYYNNSNTWRDRWCSDLWYRVIHSVPEDECLFGPRHYGDTCINCEYATLYTIRSHKWRGEQIKVHSLSGGKFTSVGREIAMNRTKADLAVRLLSHASVSGHGLRWSKVDDVISYRYPSSMLESTIGQTYKNRYLPYTLYGQAPEDMDELVATLTSPNAAFLRAPRQVVARSIIRQKQAYNDLVKALRCVLAQKVKRADTAYNMFESFSFD